MDNLITTVLFFFFIVILLLIPSTLSDNPPIETSTSVSRTSTTTTTCIATQGVEERVCTKTLYSGLMNYNNGSEYVPIDTAVVASDYLTYDYEMEKGIYHAYFQDDINTGEPVRFEKDGYYFIYDLSGGKMQWAEQEGNPTKTKSIGAILSSIARTSENEVYYDNAFAYTNVSYFIYNEMLKENFILSELPINSTYLFLEYTGEIKHNSNLTIFANGENKTDKNFVTQGKIEFKDIDGNTIFFLPKPTVTSVNDSDLGFYDIKVSGTKIAFNLRVNATFLESAVYPVYIDPTVKLQTNGSENIGDAQIIVSSGTNYGTGTISNIGFITGSTYHLYIEFNLSSFSSGLLIDDSELFVYANVIGVGIMGINISTTLSFNETNITGLSLPSTVALLETGVNCTQSAWCSFNVTEGVNDSYNNGESNVSFKLIPNQTNSNYIQVYTKEYSDTSLRPYLNITYAESTPPTYSNWQNNASTNTYRYGNVNFSINLSDNIGLSYYYFAHNQSGTMTNVSNGTIQGLYNFTNYTLSITLRKDNYICGQYWANDTSNNINQTNLSCFTVQNAPPILKTDLAFKNSTRYHNFTVNATFTDWDNYSDIANVTIGVSSGTCYNRLNITSGDDFTPIFNCTGTALVTTTIQINVSDFSGIINASSILTTAYPNQAPTMTLAELNKTSGVVDTDDLNCSAVGKTDLDNDATTYRYEWYNNTVSQGYDSVSLSNTNLTSGDDWYCEAWADDTYANSSKYTSSTVTIGSSEVSPSITTANATTALTGINSSASFPTNNNSWINFSVLFADADEDAWTAYFCTTPTWANCQTNASGVILCKSISNSTDKTLSCFYNVSGYASTNPRTWYAFVLDNTSKQSTSFTSTFEINYPPSLPTLVYPPINSYFNVNHTLINWTATEPDSDTINYTIYINSSTMNYTLFYNGTAKGFNFTNATNENETYNWRVYTSDQHGYGFHNATLGNFSIDFSEPSISITNPTGTFSTRTDVYANWSISDFSPLDSCHYNVGRTGVSDEVSNTSVACSANSVKFNVTLDANFVFYLTANDSAGNTKVSSSSFTVDTSAPPQPSTGGGGVVPPPTQKQCTTDEDCKKFGEKYYCVQDFCIYQQYLPVCNRNSICEPEIGESILNCRDEYVNATLVLKGDCHLEDLPKLAITSQYIMYTLIGIIIIGMVYWNQITKKPVKKEKRFRLPRWAFRRRR